MRRFIFTLLLSGIFATISLSQIVDDFSDGNFSANPVWAGETAEFIVNAAGELQLSAPDAGNSLLMTQGNIPDSAVWDMNIRMAFAPSVSNALRIWLQANANSNTADGYFLEIGENGNLDALRFYKMQGGTPTLLATGVPGDVGADPVNVRIEVRRAVGGDWTVALAQAGGSLAPQFSVNDNTFSGGTDQWFGFYCLYSATRKDKYFFDDIAVLPDLPDQQPPQLLSVNVVDNQTIDLLFNEPIDSLSAVSIPNYSISSGVNLQSAAWSAAISNQVRLVFVAPFQNGQDYTITATNIRDFFGNIAGAQNAAFSFLLAETAGEFDILINEIMADPSPSVGLPASAEWLEIVNRSNKYIELSTLQIIDGGGIPKTLPAHIMLPGEWLVLCTPAAKTELQVFTSNILEMAEFPSLNNDGESLTLVNQQNTLVDQINFSPEWHTDFAKREGGWSLERINSNLYCLGNDNWQSCPQPPGGSPGAINFSNSTAPDITPPHPIQVTLVNAQVVEVTFSEGLDIVTAVDPSNYLFSPSISVNSVSISTDNRAKVQLQLVSPMLQNVLYSLFFGAGLMDCSGNSAPEVDTLKLGIADQPMAGDVVINEILFNPATGGSRFVEVYNKSNKIFNLKGFYLANYFEGVDIEEVTTERLFLPGDYLVFTIAPTDISARFSGVNNSWLIDQNLPSLDDKKDNISIYWSLNGQYVLLDSFDYTSDYHNALLSVTDQEGVSLERIRVDGPTNDGANWTSAANSGTPTQPNSQRRQPVVANDLVALSSTRISPDGDSFEDHLDIQFKLPDGGYSANLTIFDSDGLPVKNLLNQQITGASGTLRWDGDSDDGSAVRPGIYILFLEIFSATGDVEQVKLPFAVVGQF